MRGGGSAPKYEDVSLYDFTRRIIETHNLDIPAADDEELSEAAYERLFDGTDTMEGVVALLYTAGWAFTEIRERLKSYEDTGLSPEQVAAMKQELIDERHRHDRLQDFEVDEAQELAKVKAERDAAMADLRTFAEDVAHQFGYHSQYNGRLTLTHGGLSTLEQAFDILGWENPHPDPENECQYEGCHHYASCGTPANGGYLRLCGHHYAVIRNGVEAALSINFAPDTNVGGKEEE